jgi:BNR repeat-containing family member
VIRLKALLASLAVGVLLLPWGGVAHSTVPRMGSWGPGSWCWFGDPRAVRVGGQTFVGWIDWQGAIRVGAFDASSGIVGTAMVGHMFHDDHGSPALLVEPGNRLTVFWSGHNGSRMFYRTTVAPADIGAWGPVHEVPSQIAGRFGFTYPNPVLLPDQGDTLYLFWRGADWSADYATRSAGGSWSLARELVRIPGGRPYLKVDGDGSDRIGLAFTDGHPRSGPTSIYYAAYRRGWLWTAAGRRIAPMPGTPIRPRRADVVYDGRRTRVASWVWDVAIGTGAHPVTVYATFPSPSRHAYWYARFTGRRWVSHFLTFAGPSISPGTIEQQYSGGIALDHSDPSVVYLSRDVRGEFEIERWTTPDGGYGWRHVTVVRGGGKYNVRPVVPRGADGGPISLLWLRGQYNSYTGYRTSVDYLR